MVWKTSLDGCWGEKGRGNNGQYEGGDYSAIPGEPGIDYPIYTEIPKTSFDCVNQRWPGYYADVEAQCQVFHICALNRTFDFLCPNGTIFSQKDLVCVWWNQFDCSSAPSLYDNNAYIYDYSQQGQQQPGVQQSPAGLPGNQGGTGPTASFGGNQGPTGPTASFGGNQGPTGPTASFGGNRGPTGPSVSFGGNKGPTGPSVSYPGAVGPVGPTASYPGSQGPISPSASYPPAAGPSGPAVNYPGAQGPIGPSAAYPGAQGPTVSPYPGSSPAGFPSSVGPTSGYPGSSPSATGYPAASTPAFGGYPASDSLYPSASPPNREYLPPARI